ncbi:chromosomal replication initiator protein DnaA [Pontiella sulfatireligans]|uniref:Chromosomal replication initiator protein DnaA n=1 Tax=Pontiella sulfatireligans TaxID=2750658 RepID=A0A6C2USG7_9BACT|nr:chromosomal replication initiator protein DnaA [Pontiella sulfatireligans]VGO22167.1 Chromosomal replication initiator protein DnaA [Pontiella sulfatireligans]
MSMENSNIWNEACKQLKGILSGDIYDRWIAVIQCVDISDTTMRLAVANDFYKDWLEENYFPMIRKAVMVVSGKEINISLEVDSSCFDIAKEEAEPEQHAPISIPGLGFGGNKKPTHNLNPNYTFDSYVVGPANQFAHAASMAAANSPSRTYNPLFIYGGVGLGKTHLMQAIGNHVASKKPRAKICYITCETFLNEYIDALQNNNVAAFRKRYRKIDMLMIDDIQFLDGKARIQEEFFHTFNTLFESHKQIVLTSDRTPSEMAGLAPRLISRFEWGLVTELGKPDVETRTAILRKKAELLNLKIDNTLLDYLAERISSNVRSLEGALIRVASFMSLTNQKVDVEKVESLLHDLLDKESQASISVDIIQRTVAEYFDLRPSDLTGKKRTKDIAWPRQIAMHLSRSMTTQSFPVIGEQFSRNHATILYANEQVAGKAKEDRGLQQTIAILKDKVNKNCAKAIQ